jgi:transcriptional regulator with XRE-family HTH domain
MAGNGGPNVGQRIRALRERQGLSLRSLAEKCGLSINAISRIERGENSPTVSSLHQLASALAVPITEFFQDETDLTAVVVRQDARLSTERDGITVASLGIGLRKQQVQPFLITLQPGAGTTQDPVTHPGQEFVYCVEGLIVYTIGDTTYTLYPGDSLLFEATQPHSFENQGDADATLLITFNAERGSHLGQHSHLNP